MTLPNFHKVSDELSRGAQPDREGFIHLRETGFKTVLNLRGLHTDRWLIRDLGFSYQRIRMWTWDPEKEDISRFLRIMAYAKCMGTLPVFIHCLHGSDRTGCMVAAYRVRVQGWSKDEAIKEMVDGPFGFHHLWEEVLTKFVNKI